MIENRMVIEEANDSWEEDAYEKYGDICAVIDYLFDTDKVHEVFESYLDAEDLEEKEEQCKTLFEAMEKTNKVQWREFLRNWIRNNEDAIARGFDTWYAEKD